MVSLYRHFSFTGTLLYIGISINHLARLYAHELASEWYEQIQRIEIEHYTNLDDAMVAEKKQ